MKKVVTMSSTRPSEFTGSDEERQANNNTHRIDWEELRCMFCDCRPSGRWYDYPCGADPKTLPGTEVWERHEDGTEHTFINGVEVAGQ
jgi:hypothetical protein